MFPIKWQCWGIPVFAILAQTNMRSLVFVGYMLVIYIYIYNQERIPWILILAWNPSYVLHKSKAYDISQYIMIYIYICSLPHQNLPLALNSIYIYICISHYVWFCILYDSTILFSAAEAQFTLKSSHCGCRQVLQQQLSSLRRLPTESVAINVGKAISMP